MKKWMQNERVVDELSENKEKVDEVEDEKVDAKRWKWWMN